MGIKRYKNVSQTIANNKIDCNKKNYNKIDGNNNKKLVKTNYLRSKIG